MELSRPLLEINLQWLIIPWPVNWLRALPKALRHSYQMKMDRVANFFKDESKDVELSKIIHELERIHWERSPKVIQGQWVFKYSKLKQIALQFPSLSFFVWCVRLV